MNWCQSKLNELNTQKFSQPKQQSMHKSLPKLIALKERIANIQNIHSQMPADEFENMANQFLKESEKLKLEFNEDLTDFKASNYGQFKTPHDSYFTWASKALIADIQYFVDFLENVELGEDNIDVSSEGVYFAGQHFDALMKINDIISTAKQEIILIDNYLNEKILGLLGTKNPGVNCRVLTLEKSLTTTLKTFIEAFNKQYQNLEVKTTSSFHDRFLIIDQKDFYHFGASLKDAGNKGFMFSKIEENIIRQGLLSEVSKEWEK